MVVCNAEVLSDFLVLLVDAVAVDGTDVVVSGLVDLTERWIDCLLLLLAIEDEVGEEVAVLQFVVVVLVNDTARVDLDVLCILSDFIIFLSSFFDL